MIFLGTLYPLFLDALFNVTISVGAPYFDSVFSFAFLPIALLMTPGIAVNWKTGRIADALRTSVITALVSALLTALILLAGPNIPADIGGTVKTSTWLKVSVGWWVSFWVMTGPIVDAVLRSRKGIKVTTFATLGMAMAHIGVGLTMAGALAVHSYQEERNVTMYPGQIMTVGDVTYRLDRVEEQRGPNYQAAVGFVTVLNRAGEVIANLVPEKRNYDSVQTMTMTEAAILHRPWEDLYVSMGTPTPDNKGWVMRLYVKPFVTLIWIGTLGMALGGLLGLTGALMRRRRTTTLDPTLGLTE